MTDLAIPLLVVGLVCLAFSKSLLYKIGCVSFGIGCIFLAMNGFESLADPLSSFPLTHQSLNGQITTILLGLPSGQLLQPLYNQVLQPSEWRWALSKAKD